MNNPVAFTRLKPLLVKFLQDFSIQNIIEIENVVKDLDPDSVNKLQEFICLPFITRLTLLSTKQNERIVIKSIEFLTFMFKNNQLKEWKFFVDIFSVLMSKISNVKDMNKTSSASEELKLSVCESLSNLVCCVSEEIFNEMYSFTFRPQLAHAFFVLNTMLKEEKSKTLIKAVLQTMGALTYNDLYLKKKYEMTEFIASEALASCLPGLSITLLKVITGDDKQAHGVITMAIDILGKLIILTVGNASYARGIANDSSSEIYRIAYKCGNLHNVNESATVDSIPLVLKNEAWFESVAQNLEFVIKNMTVVSAHSHWKVRYYFLKFSESLICSCNKTLNNCIATLLPLIFGLSVDSSETVSSSAKKALLSLLEKFKSINCSSLNEIVEDSIEKLVAQLIKCKFSANDTKKLTILKSLLGYIEISSLSLNKLVFSTTFLHRIILTFLTLLEFDVSELNLIEELPTVEDFDVSHLLWPKKKFNFFENEEILSVICKICNYLGKIGNARVLIEYLLEKLSSNDLHTLQCIFVIGSVIKGLSNESDVSQKYSNLITDVLEVFLSPSFFDVPLYNDNLDTHRQVSVESTFLTQNVLNKNMLQVCLLLEAIANCSECLKADFKIHLMTVLCPVMEKAGMSNYVISQCGRLCLQHIANFCQYTSVHKLIKDNVDYITNVVMINFHACLHKPEIAFVLRIAMEHSDAEAIVLFRDLIFQVLDFLDYNQDKAYPLLQVLLSVAVSIKKWFPCKKDSIVNNSSKNGTEPKSLKKAVEDYVKLKKVSELEMCTDDNTEQFTANSALGDPGKENFEANHDTDDDGILEKTPKIPLHINIICEIFKRCIHLQSSENRFARMLTLEIVEVCILVLCDYENELCPLIHEFWNPFLIRFTEDTFVPKAFNVLLTIANECGDFIRSRTFKEVMPKIVLFLKQENCKSILRSFHKYQYTTNHSLQILLLSEVGNLCTKFYVNEKEFNAIVTVCISYLKKEQPKVLQEAAVKSLKALSVIDSDAVWFYWNVAYSKDGVLIPPHESLVKVSFPYCDNSLISSNIAF